VLRGDAHAEAAGSLHQAAEALVEARVRGAAARVAGGDGGGGAADPGVGPRVPRLWTRATTVRAADRSQPGRGDFTATPRPDEWRLPLLIKEQTITAVPRRGTVSGTGAGGCRRPGCRL
jgi:hypothetical protein